MAREYDYDRGRYFQWRGRDAPAEDRIDDRYDGDGRRAGDYDRYYGRRTHFEYPPDRHDLEGRGYYDYETEDERRWGSPDPYRPRQDRTVEWMLGDTARAIWPEGPHRGRGPKGYQRSDERILEDASESLTRHGRVDASNIEVEVENGEVTLEGTVDNRAAKRMAEDAVEQVPGVRDVHNRLRIK
jgi:hypothetical protein